MRNLRAHDFLNFQRDMPIFDYQALNAQGQAASGQLEAGAVQDAISELESRGLILQSIGLATPVQTPPEKPAATTSAPVSKVVESKFLRTHLTKVLERGKSLIPALRPFSKEVGAAKHRKDLNALVRILERGDVN